MTRDGESVPKRRRVDVPPSNESIARTNATLQYLTMARQNRWMHGHGQEDEMQTPGARNLAVNQNANGNAQASNGRTSSLDPNNSATRAHPSPLVPPAANLVQQQVQPADSRAASIMAYTIPLAGSGATLGLPAVNPPAVSERKSLETSMRSGLPGLPSPAPSDENTNSPTFANIRIPQLQGARPLGEAMLSSRLRPAASLANASVAPGEIPQHVIQNTHHSTFQQTARQRSAQTILHQERSEHQSVRAQQQGNQQHWTTPLNISEAGPSMATNMQTNEQLLHVPSTLPSNNVPLQPQASPMPLQALSGRQMLWNALDNAETRVSATSTLSATDTGRLELLRSAVLGDDQFYQVLSQLFCLRSVSAHALPESVRDLPNICYHHLSLLLASNTEVEPDLLHFFAVFPKPMMYNYWGDTRARSSFEDVLQRVKTFLAKLPVEWDRLLRDCRKIHCPPLAQDLTERLCLHSVVLQRTIFRSIARMIYGVGPSTEKVISAVMKIHEMDYDTYHRLQYHRNAVEKQEAYLKLRKVYDSWRSESQRLGNNINPETAYIVPQDVTQFFQCQPSSPMLNFQQQQQQQQQQPCRPSSMLAQGHPRQSQSQQHVQLPQHGQQYQQLPSQQQLHDRFLTARVSLSRTGVPGPNAQYTALQQHQARMASTSGTDSVLRSNQHGSQTQQPAADARHFYPLLSETPRPQPTEPDAAISALHQAHLRSPVLRPAIPARDSSKLYRHVKGFLVPPTQLKSWLASQAISLRISAQIMARVPQTRPPRRPGERALRHVREGSLLFRLRCTLTPPNGFATESAWVSADNYWPESLHFELNGTMLDVRRKLQHGRHLPVDITSEVKEGTNELKVFSDQQYPQSKTGNHVLAIEAIVVRSHQNILDGVTRIPADKSLSTIKASLAGADSHDNDDDDDDITVTSSSMTINLFDPLSGCKIFDLPVRGAACLHKDCFDLETFLSMCRRDKVGCSTVVDCWRCPLCRGDVRPQSLVLDEFLLQVRGELASYNKLETRAIVIDANGSWHAKHEETTAVQSRSIGSEGRDALVSNRPTTAPVAPIKHVEIVELD